jgi:hypothetical protein
LKTHLPLTLIWDLTKQTRHGDGEKKDQNLRPKLTKLKNFDL